MSVSLGTIVVLAIIAIPCYFGAKRIARSFSRKGGCGCDAGSSCHCEEQSPVVTGAKDESTQCCCCQKHDGSCCDEAGHEHEGKFNANCTHENSLNGTKKCCCNEK